METWYMRKLREKKRTEKEREELEHLRLEAEFEECCRTGKKPPKGFYEQSIEDRPDIEDVPF